MVESEYVSKEIQSKGWMPIVFQLESMHVIPMATAPRNLILCVFMDA